MALDPHWLATEQPRLSNEFSPRFSIAIASSSAAIMPRERGITE
jgi:hypothetical protein